MVDLWGSCFGFPLLSLAVAEHRLIPSRARSVCHQLRKAGHQSVWSPADQVAGGHAGVGVVSLGGALLTLSSFNTPQFEEFFRLGRALRTTLPTGKGGVVHLFVVYGNQGAEEDSEKLLLTDKLLPAVLAEAQVVFVGQPLLIAGDLNADPGVVPCLAKGISSAKFVDLVLALLGREGSQMSPAILSLMSVLGPAGILWLVALRLLLAVSLREGSLLISLFWLIFSLAAGMLRFPALWPLSQFGALAGLTHLTGPLLLHLVLSTMLGIFSGRSLG